MTDMLEIIIVRIHARNVHRVHGHKCLDDDASVVLFFFSLSFHESDGVVFSMRWGAVLLKHKKSYPDNLCISGAVAVWVASRPEACRLSQLQGCGFESAPLTSIA